MKRPWLAHVAIAVALTGSLAAADMPGGKRDGTSRGAKHGSGKPEGSKGKTASADAPAPPQPMALEQPERQVPEPDLAQQLKLTVTQKGPLRPWMVRIKNLSDEPVHLAGDVRLLWLEVLLPGKDKPEQCRLPKSLLEHSSTAERDIVLKAGGEYRRTVDPRFYCFSEGMQDRLVPNAVVYPHFGWPEKTRTLWKRGKRHKQVLKPTAPFVAWPKFELDPEDPEAKPKPAKPSAENALKDLRGQPFALGADYALWSEGELPSEEGEEQQEAPPLKLTMTRGSDAYSERSVTVQVGVTNQTSRNIRLYLRREHITYEVMGPNGLALCTMSADYREPDPQAYTTLTPGTPFTMTSRLVEFCPRGTFARPGIYLISAAMTATNDGSHFGIDAFSGQIATFRPVAVRVRTGEQPFLIIRRRPKSATPAPTPSAPVPTPAAPPPPATSAPPPPPPPAPSAAPSGS